jgi:hypothetical protein
VAGTLRCTIENLQQSTHFFTPFSFKLEKVVENGELSKAPRLNLLPQFAIQATSLQTATIESALWRRLGSGSFAAARLWSH